MKIAVLALQGAFAEHERMLRRLGIGTYEIRGPADLEQPMDGLILPGGESTVQGRLLRELGLMEPLRTRIRSGLPVMGTCAGLLLLAKKIANDSRVHLAVMDIIAVRNVYGRQLGSFFTLGDFEGIGRIPMTFIRAPCIAALSDGALPLASVDGRIVAARQRNILVTAFHPELDGDPSVHRYFAEQIVERYRGLARDFAKGTS